MEKIVLSEFVQFRLEELVDILYYKGYFDYKENSIDYVNKIYDFILTIPTQKQKRTLNKNQGEFYCCFKTSSRTSWYIIFDIKEDFYYVNNITNNHTRDYVKYIPEIN